MKTSLIMGLLILTACLGSNDSNQPGIVSVERRSLDPQPVSTQVYDQISQVCNALTQKENNLDDLVTESFSFSYGQKRCEENAQTESDEVVTLSKVNNGYYFRRSNGEDFPFAVETRTQGSMKIICDNLGSLTNPFQTSNANAIWFTTTPGYGCEAGQNEVCVGIEKGTLEGNTDYLIQSREYIRFRIAQPRIGFYTDRALSSWANCEGGVLERRAILR